MAKKKNKKSTKPKKSEKVAKAPKSTTSSAASSVKDPGLYRALRDEGIKKKKAARIANAAAASSRSAVAQRGASSPAYEEWTLTQLRARARELEIPGRSSMAKAALVDALRTG